LVALSVAVASFGFATRVGKAAVVALSVAVASSGFATTVGKAAVVARPQYVAHGWRLAHPALSTKASTSHLENLGKVVNTDD
jgi:hypothetical protein